METKTLTTAEARRLHELVSPQHGFANRLVRTLEKRGFSGTKVHALTVKARDALQHLSVELHYESCGHGVGRPAKDE